MKMYTYSIHRVFSLLRRKSGISLRLLVSLTVLSSLLKLMLLVIINGVVGQLAITSSSPGLFAMYAFGFVLWILATRMSHHAAIFAVQNVIHRLRLRILGRIRLTDLRSLERAGHTEVFSSFTFDTEMISSATLQVVRVFSSAFLTAGCLLYLAWLSPWALFLTGIGIAAGGLFYGLSLGILRILTEETREQEKHLHRGIKDVLFGFQELRLHDARNDDFFHNDYSVNAARLREFKVHAATLHSKNHIMILAGWWGLVMAIGSILPALGLYPAANILLIISVILYMPLDVLLFAVPYLNRAAVSVDRLLELERRLDEMLPEAMPVPMENRDFSEIRADNITFRHRDPIDEREESFVLGPISFTIRKGEAVFIVGGNGAGKSTLMKLLCGLYRPESGSFSVDGQEANMGQWGRLYTSVFAEYRVFEHPYGLKGVDPGRVNALLETVDIAHKTSFEDGRFVTRDLSTGQRHRLALVEALLDDAPILMLDEMAADQDPAFRKKFFTELVPTWKAQGRTIVLITHDERFLGHADQVIHLDYGRQVEPVA